MLIYLQKCYPIFDNVDFWFNRHYIDDVKAFFFLLVLKKFNNLVLLNLYLLYIYEHFEKNDNILIFKLKFII